MPAQIQPFLKYTDSLTELAKDFVAIQTKSLSKFNALNKDALVAWCDSGSTQFGAASAPKNYQDWLESQTKLIGEHGAQVQKYATDYFKVLEGVQAEFTGWVQRGTESITQSTSEIFKTKAA